MRIALLGKNGQVGRELMRTLLPMGEIFAFGREDLNLENITDVIQVLDSVNPSIIVNAAAYTKVDVAEIEQDQAFAINSHLVEKLAQYAKYNKILLIHYSTDYVFDGSKESSYIETDATNPLNIYGKSKLAGENFILDSGCNYLIFRTSWVYSSFGNNFIKTILKLSQNKSNLQIVSDQSGSPTSAELIADVTSLAILAYNFGQLSHGIYNLTSSAQTTWYNLAVYSVDYARGLGMKGLLSLDKIEPILSKDYIAQAKRPLNSRLNNRLLSSTLNITFPHWSQYVDRMITQLIKYEMGIKN